MANPMVAGGLRSMSWLGDLQARANGVERYAFDPTRRTELEPYGLDLVGEGLETPSRGLNEITAAAVEAFALHVASHATGTAVFVDNAQSEALPTRGHAYLYRGPRTRITDDAVAFLTGSENNSRRLWVRAFINGALELPPGTYDGVRERLRGGARGGALLRELHRDPQVKAYQRAQWDGAQRLSDHSMLGKGSVVVVARQERHVLHDGRYVVDVYNPVTRELHVLDGSVLWLRIVDTSTSELVFATIGTGQHRFAVMDATNNVGAMGIWHYLALAQQWLYAGVPPDSEDIAPHIRDAVRRGGPIAVRLARLLGAQDNALTGAFLRGLRRKHVYENGDGYL